MFNPDQLSIKRGGGCFFTLFGLPFFAFGLMFMIASLGGHVKSSDGGVAPALMVVPFSLVFVCVGGGIMFGRIGVRIDRIEKTVTSWWGLLFLPFWSKRRSTDEFDIVTITQEVRRTKNSTYTVYPVKLTGKGDDVKIEEPRQYDQSRKLAEKVAKFMDLGVKDSGRGETVVREAGTLDECLRDRFKRTGKVPVMPEQPANCKSIQSVEGDEAAFDIPPPGFGIVHLLAVGGGAFFAIMVGVFFAGPFFRVFSDSDGKAFLPAVVFMGILATLPILLVVVPALFAAKTRDRILVSTRGIRLVRRFPIGGHKREIPAEELEELTIAAPSTRNFRNAFARDKVVSARSDRQMIEFGAGLTKEEVRWLRDVVEYLVTAPER